MQDYDFIFSGTTNVNITLTTEQLKEFAIMVAETTANKILENKEEKLYSRQEVLDKFGIAPGTLCNWQNYGLIKKKKIANRVYYPASEIEKLSKIQQN